MVSIAIDGPSGAGKSSLAKALAKDLGYVYVDTGAMYRSIGLYAVRAGADPHDADAVAALLPGIKLDIRLLDGTQHVYLNGEDVSTAIRAENIGMAASAVAAHPAVRTFLLDTQRGLAESQNILMDGRDIGREGPARRLRHGAGGHPAARLSGQPPRRCTPEAGGGCHFGGHQRHRPAREL